MLKNYEILLKKKIINWELVNNGMYIDMYYIQYVDFIRYV